MFSRSIGGPVAGRRGLALLNRCLLGLLALGFLKLERFKVKFRPYLICPVIYEDPWQKPLVTCHVFCQLTYTSAHPLQLIPCQSHFLQFIYNPVYIPTACLLFLSLLSIVTNLLPKADDGCVTQSHLGGIRLDGRDNKNKHTPRLSSREE